MPSKNTIKQFGENQMWHVYNRGTYGRNIFVDELDYSVFLSYLKICLSEELPSKEALDDLPILESIVRLRRMNLQKEVELVSYCLMPNHFHLQLYQYSADGISKLMRSILTGYSMYYNRRHESYGHLFQGIYKASLISSDAYWLHISRYIHLNPIDINEDYAEYPNSSYKYYLNANSPSWLHPEWIMKDFTGNSYAEFVRDHVGYKKQLEDLKHLLADTR
jgi:putative transposase